MLLLAYETREEPKVVISVKKTTWTLPMVLQKGIQNDHTFVEDIFIYSFVLKEMNGRFFEPAAGYRNWKINYFYILVNI